MTCDFVTYDTSFVDVSNPFLTRDLITYIGNKRQLLPFLKEGFDKVKQKLGGRKMVCFDGFSGSGSVARLLKFYSSVLHVNDLEPYAETLNHCYLRPSSSVNMSSVREAIKCLNEGKKRRNKPGIIEMLYSPKDDKHIIDGERVFYTNINAKIIDNIRQAIEDLPDILKVFCLAPLLVRASIHVNTAGIFKGFYKNRNGIGQFGGEAKNALKRICEEIELKVPMLSDVEHELSIHRDDTNLLVSRLGELDLTYYDPPYNQHPYGSNYFMLNVIDGYKMPTNLSNVSGIPNDWNKSAYNKKQEAECAMEDLIENTNSKFILISYNNEGIIPEKSFREILERHGKVEVMKQSYNAFRGSRNLDGRSLKVKELLWIVQK